MASKKAYGINRTHNHSITYGMLFLCVLAIALVVFSINRPIPTSSNAAVNTVILLQCPKCSPPGVPAINPAVLHAKDSTILLASADANIKSYIASNKISLAQTAPKVTPVLDILTFITESQSNALLNTQNTGLNDNANVIYVRESGPFILNSPNSQSPLVSEYRYGIRVFDSATGNLLLVGFQN